MTSPATPHIEAIYEALAEAIDRAGVENEAVFLTKLALTLGATLNDADAFRDAIRIALTDPGGRAASDT